MKVLCEGAVRRCCVKVLWKVLCEGAVRRSCVEVLCGGAVCIQYVCAFPYIHRGESEVG